MRSRPVVVDRIAYLRAELAATEDGIEVMLLSRSINELEWVLGYTEVLNG